MGACNLGNWVARAREREREGERESEREGGRARERELCPLQRAKTCRGLQSIALPWLTRTYVPFWIFTFTKSKIRKSEEGCSRERADLGSMHAATWVLLDQTMTPSSRRL